MKYGFIDINNEELFKGTRVMLITGEHMIFNNMVYDRLKELCKPTNITAVDDIGLLSDFGITSDDMDKASDISANTLNFNEFISNVGIPPLNGKWFCSIDIQELTKKQKEELDSYIKNPSENGILIIRGTEFKDYVYYLRNKSFLLSGVSNIIQLNFPRRDKLTEIVKEMFISRGVTIDEPTAELFITRLSKSYDTYTEVIDKVCQNFNKETKFIKENLKSTGDSLLKEREINGSIVLSYKDMLNNLKGIENFVLDDFIERLTEPLDNNKSNNKKIYKMWVMIQNESGAVDLVKRLKYQIDSYIEFRLAINKGIIPILVRYDINKVKEQLKELYKTASDDEETDGKKKKVKHINDIADFKFRKMALVASKTSLRDWIYMKMLLSNYNVMYTNEQCEKLIYSLINRTVYNSSRLNNNIGYENVLDLGISLIDSISYCSKETDINKIEED